MKKLLLILCLIAPVAVFSQAEATWWFFGENAGLDFNGGSPTPVRGSLDTIEGCSAISDRCGMLLMYSDGRTIWDRNGNPFPGANGILLGNASAAQSAIIVPDLIAPGIYYVFTVGTGFGGQNVNYNIVNMNLRGGLGDVLPGRINIPLRGNSHEKISAVLHADGRSYWLMTYDDNNYQAFRVAGGGVNPVPVTSIINSGIVTDNRGTIKFSPDGTKLANVSVNDNGAVIADFDNVTGIVSNEIQLGGLGASNECYGIEFSSNSQLLYVDGNSSNGGNGCGGNNVKSIYQYNLTQANFQNTPFTVFTANNYQGRGALQQAIDGKIYVTRTCTQNLSVIENPNVVGSGANYRENLITVLAGTRVREGLPPFITSFFAPNFDVTVVGSVPDPNVTQNQFCITDIIQFDTTSNDFCPTDTVFWDFGDGIGSSTMFNPTYQYTAPGNYIVTLTVTGASFTVSATLDIVIFATPTAEVVDDLFFCSADSSGGESLDLDALVTSTVIGTQDPTTLTVNYFLSRASAENNLSPLSFPRQFNQGTTEVFVRISNNAAQGTDCFEITSFDVVIGDLPPFVAIPDIEECDDLPSDGMLDIDLSFQNDAVLAGVVAAGQDPNNFMVNFFPTQMDADMDTNEILAPVTSFDNDVVVVRLTNNTTGCTDTATIRIRIFGEPTIGTAMDVTVCDEFPIDGIQEIDLTDQDPEILAGQSSADFTVAYFNSQTDAENDVNQLPSLYDATDGEVIVARIMDNNTGCTNFSTFMVTVEGCEPIFPQGLSPNADGDNDVLEIVNIDQFPSFTLKVFSRHGRMVYETTAANYEPFAGIASVGSSSELLPAGTYFYTIEFNDPNQEDIVKWVYLTY